MLTPVGAQGYDALGLASDPGDEDNAGAKFAIDGNQSTAWHTQFYLQNPALGGLKKGTGLLLDMGRAGRCCRCWTRPSAKSVGESSGRCGPTMRSGLLPRRPRSS